jgi:hypothetical protein
MMRRDVLPLDPPRTDRFPFIMHERITWNSVFCCEFDWIMELLVLGTGKAPP